MDKRKQGDIGVSEAILYYTKLGYEVFHPLTEATRVDLIVLKEDKILRVQCKTSTFRPNGNDAYSVALTTSGGNRSWSGVKKKITCKEVDIVFMWCDDDSLWVVSASELDGKASFSAGKTNRNYCVRGKWTNPEYRKSPDPMVGPKREYVHGGKKYYCIDCEVEITRGSVRCRSHASKNKASKTLWPAIDELVSMVRSTSYLAVGDSLGVSDNAVRKHLKVRGYDPKTLRKLTSK